MLRYLSFASAMALVATLSPRGAADSAVVVHPTDSLSSIPEKKTHCPAWPGGTGILADGDFALAIAPPSGQHFYAGQKFAPDWKVAKGSIDLLSTHYKAPSGVCSVDLDGDNHSGSMKHKAFGVTPSAVYTVSFLFSGSVQCAPTVKTMKVEAAGQSQVFTWDTSNGHNAENGVFEQEAWSFTATSASTTLEFASLDPTNSDCGPVVAAISVTQN